MAVNNHLLKWMNELFEKYSVKNVAEYGDQIFWTTNNFVSDYYKAKKIETVSFDLSGRHGSVSIDLGEPIPELYVGKFDAVTNHGTIEHINGQYNAWKNADLMCKIGGIMLHHLPAFDQWPNHCRYFYKKEFPEALAKVADYRIISNYYYYYEGVKDWGTLIVAFEKISNSFLSEEKFMELPIHDSLDLRFTGNYIK